MFNTLAGYLLGTSNQVNGVVEANIRLTSITSDDDWVLVDRDSDRNSEIESDSAESLDECDDVDDQHNQLPSLLTRTSSSASLTCTTMEESWFVTPPPCFTSAGPIHMETSPLENLLIEHPSMSVYQHTHPALLAHRHLIPIEYITESFTSDEDEEDVENLYAHEIQRVEDEVEALRDRHIRVPHRHRSDILRQEEKQWYQSKQAQKVQLHKSYKLITRKYLERANKAREATNNCHQRRSNYFRGTNRYNRKC